MSKRHRVTDPLPILIPNKSSLTSLHNLTSIPNLPYIFRNPFNIDNKIINIIYHKEDS